MIELSFERGKNIFKQSGDVGSVPWRECTGAMTVWGRPGSLKNLKKSQWVESIQLLDEEEEGRFVMRYCLRGLSKDSGLYSKSNRSYWGGFKVCVWRK